MPTNNRGLECPRCLGPMRVKDSRYDEVTHKRTQLYVCKEEGCGFAEAFEFGLPAHLYGGVSSDELRRRELAILRRYQDERGFMSPRPLDDMSPMEIWLMQKLARKELE